MQQELNTTDSSPPVRSCASPAQEPAWMQERLTLRLTRARREALLAIATVEGQAMPPLEAIDRAIELACRFLRETDVGHATAKPPEELGATGPVVSDRPNAAHPLSDIVADTVRLGREGAENPGRHWADSVGIGEKSANTVVPTLAAWLTLELKRHGKPAAKAAVMMLRKTLAAGEKGGEGESEVARLGCRLIALDGHRIGRPGPINVSDGAQEGWVLAPEAMSVQAAAIVAEDRPCFLWGERPSGADWMVHVHRVGDTGVGSAVAAFSMSDT